MEYHPRSMAKPFRRKGSRFYYIAPMVNGIQVPQSSHTTDYAAALKKLKELEGAIASGRILTPLTDRGTFAELLEAVKVDYRVKDRRSSSDLERRINKHLVPALGNFQARQVSSAIINEYVLIRLRSEDQPANGTVNRELAIIKRAFNLAEIAGRVSRIPHIEMLPEDNERESFYSPEQFQSVLKYCNPTARAVLEFAYITGWRMGSILRLQWHQVDLRTGFVWLNARDTKNRKAVRWPLVAGLRELLELRRAETDTAEKGKGMIIPVVFHRNGKPVKSIRTAWLRARVKAGVPGHVMHDFRGTATVNLLEAGVDIPKIMAMVGFKTVQMVERYARRRGAREESLLEAGEKLERRLGTALKVKTTTAGSVK
jgi:integrase